MTTMVEMTVKKVLSQERIKLGSRLSMVSMSREKRLRMRPIGVVSKNSMGERRTLCSMPSCRMPEARTMLIAVMMEYSSTKKATRET